MPARPAHPLRWLVPALALAAGARPALAQDVEMLGRRYGTQPPAAYFRELARDPQAFRFLRGRAEPARMLERARAMSAADAAARAPARALGPREDPVVGTYRIPLLLGLFSDSPPAPYTRPQVQTAFFDGPSGTVSDYYDEVSGGLLDLEGQTLDWKRSTFTQNAVTQQVSGLECCAIGDFIKNLISLQSGVNWGQFDNDGDGRVDALAIMHPTVGAECGGAGNGNRIWAHKWSLSEASSSHTPYVTSSGVLIDDYFIQGVLSCPEEPERPCDPQCLNEIGVFTHETGHAFGLPDLYDTRGVHSGVGNWDVMAHGTWGCDGESPARPCHMGAWSKAALGWVDVIELDPGMDHGTRTLQPVETAHEVYRVDAQDGSGEYFLLENRQKLPGTYEQNLPGEGLLVWQIDQNALEDRWENNEVNASSHMAVWLLQADGAEHLETLPEAPADAGDPFPGQAGNTAFHAVSFPSSNSYAGGASGLTLFDIGTAGNDVTLRALTRFTSLTVQATGASGSGLFAVDGELLPGTPPHVVVSPPFTPLTLEVAVGDLLAPGERLPFIEWTDDDDAPRSRVVITPIADRDYEATFGPLQYQLAIPLTGGINGVAPGTVVTSPPSPDLWFAPGTEVTLSIAPQTGFAFLGWTDGLLGQLNPTTVTLDAPIFGGASFQLTYAVADVELAFTAAVTQDIQLVATEGTPPIRWSVVDGSLPPGMSLSSGGRLSGAALAAGSFPVTVEAADLLGLTDQASLDLEVGEPSLAIESLAAGFLLEGPGLDALGAAYVDHHGNGNGAYDLGDFRAWVLAHPSLPLSAAVQPVPQPSVVVVPVVPSEKPQGTGPSGSAPEGER